MAKRTQGFTLIELSIVLVIIGLIVGGVLTGRDLIAAAKVRSVMSNTQKLMTAINTFQGKYNCLPGDCPNASTFFDPDCTTVIHAGASAGSDPCNGDGDGVIYNAAGGIFETEMRGASVHLNLAHLTSFSFVKNGGGADTHEMPLSGYDQSSYSITNGIYSNTDNLAGGAYFTTGKYVAAGHPGAQCHHSGRSVYPDQCRFNRSENG